MKLAISDEMVERAQKSLNADADEHQRVGNVVVRAALEAALREAGQAEPLAELHTAHDHAYTKATGTFDEWWADNVNLCLRGASFVVARAAWEAALAQQARPRYSREKIAKIIHDSIQDEDPSQYIGPCYDTADAVIAALEAENG